MTNNTPPKNNTFIIEVKSTQNFSWQGTITWIPSQKKVSFRSTLELIRLMDSAIGTNEEEEQT